MIIDPTVLCAHDFQTDSLNIQDFLIVQIMALLEIDKRLVNAKIYILSSASKFEILFDRNISLALLRRQRANILRYTFL